MLLDGEFTIKRLKVDGNNIWLQPENPKYPIIKITEENDLLFGELLQVLLKV